MTASPLFPLASRLAFCWFFLRVRKYLFPNIPRRFLLISFDLHFLRTSILELVIVKGNRSVIIKHIRVLLDLGSTPPKWYGYYNMGTGWKDAGVDPIIATTCMFGYLLVFAYLFLFGVSILFVPTWCYWVAECRSPRYS